MRALARSSRDADQVRRLLALVTIHEGGSRVDAVQSGGVGLQRFAIGSFGSTPPTVVRLDELAGSLESYPR